MTKKKLFIVDTISQFRNRYIIEAETLEHAFDEVTMIDSGNDEDFFEPAAQKYLGETILDGRSITEKQFIEFVGNLEANMEGSYWLGEKLIRKVGYD